MTALDVRRGMFHDIVCMEALNGTPRDPIHILPLAIEHALTLSVFDKDGKTVEGGDRTPSKKRLREKCCWTLRPPARLHGYPQGTRTPVSVKTMVPLTSGGWP